MPDPSGALDRLAARTGSIVLENTGSETDPGPSHAAQVFAVGPALKGAIPGVFDAKVMIVDDASMTVRLLQAFLEDAGYREFVTTDRSTEAMSLLLGERPDVVLLDLNMPEVSGFDILTQVRAHPNLQHVPILILTASDDAASKLRALELGATDFLAKPVDTSELALRLRNTLAAKAYQDRLTYYDALTNLPNRRMFLDRLSDCFAHVQRTGESGAVLHIDLDRFRHLNDSLGHGAGDRILRTVAQRLTEFLREADQICQAQLVGAHVSASRLGGDEFVVLLPRVRNRECVIKLADRVLKLISEPISWETDELVVTMSIGILVFPEQAYSVETLLRNVALATARAKQLGRNRHEIYSLRCDASSSDQVRFESDLHRALARSELRLHYQPKVCVVTGRVSGAEALLRWQHPDRGEIGPVEFIGLAEEMGLIVPIGSWVLRTACEQQVRWRDTGLGDIGVAVNVASLQLKDGRLLGTVREVLDITGIDPARLTLELTESAVIDNAHETVGTLTAIRAMGVRLSLDDFGTGYSSLSYLEHLPIDELKIDRSFIAKICARDDKAPIVNAIVAMARQLGLQVVAEGVEEEAQRHYLERQQCELYQGRLFAMPMPPEEFLQRVRAVSPR